MKVSIIIVNYNTKDLVIDCIRSIIKNVNIIAYEIIVVDNASSDNSVETIKSNFQNIILIESEINLGFGKANNLAYEYANGEYLFFLNSDTLLINDAVHELYTFMESNKRLSIGACCGNLYNLDYTPNASYSLTNSSLITIILYRLHLSKVYKTEIFNYSSEPKTVKIILGADLFIPKIIFTKLKGFDQKFFMYIEDGDLCYRLNKEGYILKSVPSAKIIHIQGSSSSSIFKIKNEIDGYCIYFYKHYNMFYTFIYLMIELIINLFKLLISLFLFNILTFEKFLFSTKYTFYKLLNLHKGF